MKQLRITLTLIIAVLAATFTVVGTAAGGEATHATPGFATSITFDDGCRPEGCRSNPDPGGTVVVGTDDDVPAGALGLECSVQFTAANNESVHSGVNLVVSSTGEGSNSVQIPGIEDKGFQQATADSTLTLLGPITVSIVFGPDGISSLGGTVHLECVGQEITTTTEGETTTTTAPGETTTTTRPTTTTLPPTPKAPPVPAEPNFTG